MPSIRPSSDLRNNYNEISDFCNRYNEPVFITKNGTGDLVVLSNEAYERLCGQAELHKLLDAGIAQMKANKHRPASEVFEKLEKDILSLETMPFRFALLEENPYKSMGVRCLAIENYTAFYIPDKNTKTVHILRVLYNRRDWQAIL